MDKQDFKESDWKDWKWQQRNVIRESLPLEETFKNINPSFFRSLVDSSSSQLNFQITPYMLSQIPRDLSQIELEKNPWFLQFFPLGEVYKKGQDAFDGTDNWETKEEFPTSLLHHKYTNRVLLRLSACLALCNYCFEAKRTLETNPAQEKINKWSEWDKSLEYIASHPEVEEVILSGGEPLILPDERLNKILSDVNALRKPDGSQKVRFKRIHTRVLTHNPFRVTDSLVSILKENRINELALHVSHPSEITSDFLEGVYKIKEGIGKYSPLLVAHTPLVYGVNSDTDVLWELFSKLYENNIKPYYLLHSMPHTPYADRQRVSVRDGVNIMKKLKRHKSNIALPEYIIAHYEGKITVPLESGSTPEFQYSTSSSGEPVVNFLNWRNKWVTYPDHQDRLDINGKPK